MYIQCAVASSTDRAADGSAVLFWQEMIGEAQDEEIWVHRFSVEGDGSEAVRSRAIVSYKGPNSGRGKWECTKDANARCAHITKAKYLLEKFAEGWEDEDGDNALDDMYIGRS
ncbi:hypothetical protein MPER_14041 [Moniliophthora perniciosa FA553]|nr:hypothetical protein MPER_14041 [Moniliophthora perniciosa FA553]